MFVPVGPNLVRLLRDGTSAFPAMLDAIAHAQEEVLLEMYWFGADRVGERFRAALVERAKAGVRVRVMFDAIGSLETPTAFWTPLIEAGGEVQEFAPVSPFRRRFHLHRLLSRDHRKLLVVDGAKGFVGGINIGDAWAPEKAPELAWRDDCVEFHGPAVGELRTAFYDVWRPGDREGARSAPASPTDPRVRVITNRVGRHPNKTIRRTYLFALRHATTSVDLANAYFLPGALFLRALRKAARRGVRVRLLVPEHSDVRFVAVAMQAIYGRLLADDVEVFVYEPRVLHAKTAIFDGRFVLVGSHNLDPYSSRLNLECDVVVDSVEFASVVRASFERDLREAKRLDPRTRSARPLRSLVSRWLAALFERLSDGS